MLADIWQLHGEQLSFYHQDTLILLVEPNVIDMKWLKNKEKEI